jgi:hypothetical protein
MSWNGGATYVMLASMDLVDRFQHLCRDIENGAYFRRLHMTPVPHRLRTVPQLASHLSASTIAPRQAICIPTFNHEQCILETLSCLLTSISCPSELIVLDDGSEDRTVELVTSFLKSAGSNCLVEAIVLRNDVPIFETACDNICFNLAAAPYVIEVQADIFIRHPGFDMAFHRALDEGAASVSGRCGHAFNLLATPRSRIGAVMARHVRRLLKAPMYVGLAGENVETGDISTWLGKRYSCETVNRGPWALLKSDLETFGYLDERHFFLGSDDHDFHRRAYAGGKRRPYYVPVQIRSPLKHGASRWQRTGLNREVYEDLAATRRGSPAFRSFLSSHVSWRPVRQLSV